MFFLKNNPQSDGFLSGRLAILYDGFRREEFKSKISVQRVRHRQHLFGTWKISELFHTCTHTSALTYTVWDLNSFIHESIGT